MKRFQSCGSLLLFACRRVRNELRLNTSFDKLTKGDAMNRNRLLFHLNLLLVACALSGFAQSKRQEGDATEALKRVLSQKSTLVVVRSAESKDYVAVGGGVSPAGGSYWAFVSDKASLTGTMLKFADGARVVVGHVTAEPPSQKVAQKLLELPQSDGSFPTDCFDDICLNGIVGIIGGSLKLVDSTTGSENKPVSSVVARDVVLTKPCSGAHWNCPAPSKK